MGAVQDAVTSGDADGSIQVTAEQVRASTGATYVVVTDRKGIRFSHPNPALIGKPVDESPGPVLAGHTWVGVQSGTLGVSARGKAPIFRVGRWWAWSRSATWSQGSGRTCSGTCPATE